MPYMESVKCCDVEIQHIREFENKDNLYSCSVCGNQMIEPNEYYEI